MFCRCVYSKSLLTCQILNLHLYLLLANDLTSHFLEEIDVGIWIPFLLSITTFLWILTSVVFPMHLRDKTLPHLQGQYIHLVCPSSLPQELLCHILDSGFSPLTLWSLLLTSPNLHTRSALLIIRHLLLWERPCHAGCSVLSFLPHQTSGIDNCPFSPLCLHSETHQRYLCTCMSLELACFFFHRYLCTFSHQSLMTSVCCVSSWTFSIIRWQTS